jgi:hypothetical protein
MKIATALTIGTLLGGLAILLPSCHDNGGGGGTQGVGFPGNVVCLSSGNCTGSPGPCTNFTGICDKTFLDGNNKGRCVENLINGKQCVTGQVRGITKADGQPGVVECGATCDWGGPKACGTAVGDRCCAGGCMAANTHCSALFGTIGATCQAP